MVLNCQVHDVPVLVAAKLLKPLGNPPQNGVKYFATKAVQELAKDEKWLHRATLAISQHWHERNARKHDRLPDKAELPATTSA
jgi:hypothetical protein